MRIAERQKKGVPIITQMKTARGRVRANGIEIAYQSFGPPDCETVLLIPGVGSEMVEGPTPLARELVRRGYRVIAYDSRDAGRSTHMDSAGMPNWEAIQRALSAGAQPPIAYSMRDLAADATGLLDALGIPRAHIVGGSLGGMVAQTIAAEYPEHTLSLTSISSSTGNPGLTPSSAAATVAATLPANLARQGAAAAVAGDRRSRLRTITAPTMVIHGDADELFPVAHGRDTAANIPGAKLHVIAGMRHELPDTLVPAVADDIVTVARQASA
jgi:pimeloyl-ACP methyl ester carboxylesterase